MRRVVTASSVEPLRNSARMYRASDRASRASPGNAIVTKTSNENMKNSVGPTKTNQWVPVRASSVSSGMMIESM